MAKFSKWVGGGLGWVFGGPIGAIIGFGIGSLIDASTNAQHTSANAQHTSARSQYASNQMGLDDFTVALIVLSAAIMKADNQLKKQELDYVRAFFKQQLGEEKTTKAMLLLRDVLKQDFSVFQVCQQIRMNVDHSTRLNLMHYLFGIALSDNELHPSELVELRLIARYLNISSSDFDTIHATYQRGGNQSKRSSANAFEDPYKVLQIDKKSTDEEVKKAYRKMAIKYHPDKVLDQSEAAQKSAKEMFQKINAAYEQIKRMRGI